jgi:hypothetical protein
MKILVTKKIFLERGFRELRDPFALLAVSIENARQKFVAIRTNHIGILVFICTFAEALQRVRAELCLRPWLMSRGTPLGRWCWRWHQRHDALEELRPRRQLASALTKQKKS